MKHITPKQFFTLFFLSMFSSVAFASGVGGFSSATTFGNSILKLFYSFNVIIVSIAIIVAAWRVLFQKHHWTQGIGIIAAGFVIGHVPDIIKMMGVTADVPVAE